MFSPIYYTDILKLTTIGHVPFISYEREAHQLAMLDLIEEAPEFEQEFTDQNVRLLLPVYGNAVTLASTRPVASLADLDQLNIGTASLYNYVALQQWGAIPLTLAVDEMYFALSEGIVDAVFGMTPQDLVDIGIQDKARYFVETGYGTAGPVYMVINIDSYRKLSPEIQGIFDDVGKEAALKYGETSTAGIETAVRQIIAAGGEVHDLPDEVKTELYESARQPTRSAWIQNAVKSGANVEVARQILALYTLLVEEHRPESSSSEIVEIYNEISGKRN
jgi:TRAP-type C4-dicarboxylate transport system substrate-binding protein